MKKDVIVFLMAFIIFGCSVHEREMSSMPKYNSEECYSASFQDATDYCMFSYDEDTILDFMDDSRFEEVTNSDIGRIKRYFADFSQYVVDADYYEEYDFDYALQIKEGDYYYIITKEYEIENGRTYGIYDNYHVYYVDMSRHTLYYIHSSI